jgi:DNA-directed RNA polymerase specialized sigma24 family protein
MTDQLALSAFACDDDTDLEELTQAERNAWVAVRQNGVGVREYARRTDRSPGTIGNLLSRAEAKVERSA